ncbi:DNA adenine methylase [Kribbella sp. NPDC003505]|uniref:DNA adenine methylase n=1 Tax=Kribbella sp. NPDC003505 TaxID=3154448 RepID=UPI0033A85AFA
MTLDVSAPRSAGDPKPTGTARATVWRPVQYLGSKLRALDAITAVAADLNDGGVFWDAFAGSSVVAQAAAQAGFTVWATDTQQSSSAFSSAVLGVRATAQAADSLPAFVDRLVGATHPETDIWSPWLAREDELIAAGDYDSLVDLYASLPQRWRVDGEWNELTPLTTTFAGTYLSLRQAMMLDAARYELQRLEVSQAVDPWSYDAALTALCHAASEAVHSAGKHFAQPMQPATTGAANYEFVRGRSLRDRSVSVGARAIDAANQLALLAPIGGSHDATTADVLAVSADDLIARGVGVVYADPPYTAQQYSRFYHVLETLVKGVAEPIQIVRGETPKGLYPANRYLSPFCSRRQAPAAFEHLVRIARDAGAHLILSYSTTGSDSGNQRTVSEADLLTLVSSSYGPDCVSIVNLEYGYRQFNHESRRTETIGTGEVLLIGVAS